MTPVAITIWTGAQSGVDLGAALQALDLGVPIGGFMPADGRNEDGEIPERVTMHLRRHTSTNPAARTRANVSTADAALVIVRDRRRAGETRGTALTIGLCEKGWPTAPPRYVVVDPCWLDATVAVWAGQLLGRWRHACQRQPDRSRSLRLLVAGPRRSLWPGGEHVARRFVRAAVEGVRHG